MAGLRDLKRRLQSVKNTKKITYAMKLVSAAKLRKAQEAVARSREYTKALDDVVTTLSTESASLLGSHPLCEARTEIKKIVLLVIGGGRGLCGGYNTNVNRRIESSIKELKSSNPNSEIVLHILGKKPAEYARRVGHKIERSIEDLPEDPTKWPLAEFIANLEHEFISGKVDAVYMVYTKFFSALTMTVEKNQILPRNLKLSSDKASAKTKIEPDARSVFMAAVARSFRAEVLQAALDAKASETASRMTAMDSATKNAGDLIKKLQLTYNKLRQASITAELLDIIGGAEAIS
jgi:F-type H+-transporting ATPase subunit gamma